jgi:phage/plasmid-associated DNA primase
VDLSGRREWISPKAPLKRPEDAAARVRDIGAVIAREELPELARWFVHGAARLVTRGAYDVPASSAAALAEWRGEASSAALFLGDATAPARHASERTRASHLYANYKSWCEANGHRLPMTSTAFGRALRDMGIAAQKSGGVIFYPLVVLNGLDGAGRAVPLRAVS